MSEILNLSELKLNQKAVIVDWVCTQSQESFVQRLNDLGFLKGEVVEITNEAPFYKNPISIRIKDSVFALRREDVACFKVKVL
jgi:Fe2+ transport system protein FeoA